MNLRGLMSYYDKNTNISFSKLVLSSRFTNFSENLIFEFVCFAGLSK